MTFRMRPFDEPIEPVAFPSEGHSIDFHMQPSGLCSLNPAQRLGDVPAPGQLAITVRAQCIERNIDPLHPETSESFNMVRQLRSVGRQRQFLETARRKVVRQALEQLHDPPTNQWLTARDTQLAHTQIDEGAGQAEQLFNGQELRLRKELHPLCHAIGASKITAVGHRQPQIADLATKGIDERVSGFSHQPTRLRCNTPQIKRNATIKTITPVRRRICSSGSPPAARRAPSCPPTITAIAKGQKVAASAAI